MIYVNVEAVKPNGNVAGGNHWHDTEYVTEAIVREIRTHRAMWDALGHGEPITYRITVAPEASPHRTSGGRPLPVREDERPAAPRRPWWRGFWGRWAGFG